MKRVCIVCEGPTEVDFVRVCLTPHLERFELAVYPSLIKSGHGNHRGGRVTVERLSMQISREYWDSDCVTTLVDFYGFQDADGRTRPQLESCILAGVAERVKSFDPRFILPYVQMHEFESLLFSGIEQFHHVLDGWSDVARGQLLATRKSFGTPEDINDGRDTAPSKRILKILPRYNKTKHGPLIAEAIGLENIRLACPQFAAWLGQIEAWGEQ